MEEARPTAVESADQALDRVVELQRRIDALSAERAAAILEFEDAFQAAYPPSAARLEQRALVAELGAALRLPERTAESLVAESRGLAERLPATLTALGRGEFSYRHAQVLLDATWTLELDDARTLEHRALPEASRLTRSKFARRVRVLRERLRPESAVARARTAFSKRSMWVEPAEDGMAYLTAHIGAVEAQAIYARIDETARLERRDGDPRTLEQLRADILTDVLLDRESNLGVSPALCAELGVDPDELRRIQARTFGRFHGIKPTVIATVPVLSLLGRGDEPAIVEGVGPIDPETARELTSQAPSLYRLLTDPEKGIDLSMARGSYRVPEQLRLWLRIRDGSCTFPGCSISTRHSDLDHTRDWAHDGHTADFNLAHLSRGHHTLKHSGGWKVSQPRPGVFKWTSFLGRHYDVAGANARANAS